MNELRLLYIDDEKDLLELADNFFSEENFIVDTCFDFRKALDLVKNNHYDIIITDEKMPSGSGVEFIRMLREENIYNGKVVLVTGNLRELSGDESEMIQDVLFKPICFQTLITKVQNLLSSTQGLSDNGLSP